MVVDRYSVENIYEEINQRIGAMEKMYNQMKITFLGKKEGPRK